MTDDGLGVRHVDDLGTPPDHSLGLPVSCSAFYYQSLKASRQGFGAGQAVYLELCFKDERDPCYLYGTDDRPRS